MSIDSSTTSNMKKCYQILNSYPFTPDGITDGDLAKLTNYQCLCLLKHYSTALLLIQKKGYIARQNDAYLNLHKRISADIFNKKIGLNKPIEPLLALYKKFKIDTDVAKNMENINKIIISEQKLANKLPKYFSVQPLAELKATFQEYQRSGCAFDKMFSNTSLAETIEACSSDDIWYKLELKHVSNQIVEDLTQTSNVSDEYKHNIIANVGNMSECELKLIYNMYLAAKKGKVNIRLLALSTYKYHLVVQQILSNLSLAICNCAQLSPAPMDGTRPIFALVPNLDSTYFAQDLTWSTFYLAILAQSSILKKLLSADAQTNLDKLLAIPAFENKTKESISYFSLDYRDNGKLIFGKDTIEKTTFISRVKSMMDFHGNMIQNDIVPGCDVSKQQVSQWLDSNLEHKIPRKHILQLAKFFQCSVGHLTIEDVDTPTDYSKDYASNAKQGAITLLGNPYQEINPRVVDIVKKIDQMADDISDERIDRIRAAVKKILSE